MRKVYWFVGGTVAVIALVVGLIYVAVSIRSQAYTSGGVTDQPTLAVVLVPSAESRPLAQTATTRAAQPTITASAVQVIPTATPAQAILTQTDRPTTTAQPRTSGGELAIGQQVLTRPPIARDLWTAPTGGERVFDRPRLYGGASVTILAIEAIAVAVRTPEGVEGWLHETAEAALTSNVTETVEQARFISGARAQIIWPNGIPLRTQPDPKAPKILEQIKPGQECTVQELRGDWLLVALSDGTTGWARWYYDGVQYIDVAASAEVPGFQIAGVRVGIADGKRVRVVVDLTRLTAATDTARLFEAPAPQLTSDEVKVVIRAGVNSMPNVQYLVASAHEQAEVSVALAPDGLELRIVPRAQFYLRETFFLPRDAPDSPSEYDRVVVDLCFSADCPPLR
jgi:hypothetical protein